MTGGDEAPGGREAVVALPRDPSELPPPQPDGLPVGTMKPHSQLKLYYWARITQAVARATKSKWSGKRCCIDLHASYGVNEESPSRDLYWGTALLALQTFDPFDVYILGDINRAATDALATRVEALGVPGAVVHRLDLADHAVLEHAREVKAATTFGPKVVILTGDANHASPVVKLVLPGFPGQRLCLALIDPYAASYTWDALSGLVLHERMDAMILFPEDMDIERNAARGDARLDDFFPSRRWREIARSSRHVGRDLREFYKTELARQQGYSFGDDKTVRNGLGAEIYKLVYASKNKDLGIKLWNACTHEDPSGQLQLHLG